MAESTAQLIAQQYPFFSFLLNDPEVGGLLSRAVNPSEPYSQLRFQSELMNTNWFRSRSAAQREWEILVNTDPGEAKGRRDLYWLGLYDLTQKLGVPLQDPESAFMIEWNLQRGIPVDSPEFRIGMRNWLMSQSPSRLAAGSVYGAMHEVGTRARGEYFFQMPTWNIYEDAVDLAMGYKDANQLESEFRAQATSMYPWLEAPLAQGKTVREIFSPHLQTVAEEWEIDPSQIDVFSPTVQSIVGHRDPETGLMRGASLYESKVLARRDDRFWDTSRGHQLESGMVNNLLTTFGQRA